MSEAIDDYRTMEICQRAKGKERNKNHMSLKVDENGDVWAYQGNESEFLFTMPINTEIGLVQRAIRRIMRESGITRRSEY